MSNTEMDTKRIYLVTALAARKAIIEAKRAKTPVIAVCTPSAMTYLRLQSRIDHGVKIAAIAPAAFGHAGVAVLGCANDERILVEQARDVFYDLGIAPSASRNCGRSVSFANDDGMKYVDDVKDAPIGVTEPHRGVVIAKASNDSWCMYIGAPDEAFLTLLRREIEFVAADPTMNEG